MIRQARPEDIPALQELLAQILEVHHQARPDLFNEQGSKFTDQELEVLLESAEKPVFVYEDDGRIIGHLFLEKRLASAGAMAPVKTLFIDDLCVSEQVRSQGIGQALYNFALEYARQEGYYHVTLNVWNDNEKALKFYQKQQMKPLVTTMEIIL